ncbi:CaiB/BaiF CoA-transferase family protein [Pontibacter sp. HSC-36F09]|uniref:CaiB/BaiF CoA transferase family protein n=1 Tax=Pontibacter sp. HSC-36F09 TaxID=2910966 RepID=UPI00209D959C|nr:CaiB/BaiF CoA-transferase family protein [Pontibacter sp. HSC-36F09]MCP2045829.1 crotonobetainyl-CoA:carnitine CoA-transferase CaiB-like acyl-CoA transferase [Pontibacter sp. HSC-36F09]
MKMAEPVFKDLLVLELASVLAGPSVGQFFAELGATVVKLENAGTGGDVTRTWKLAGEQGGQDASAYFSAANWGKLSIGLDITQPQALEAVHKLAAKADVVIASYKPGDAEKLLVDYHTLAQLNPNLIYGHITGYGLEDQRAGYDAVIQAESGFMYMNGSPDGPPTKLPVALMDILAAHQLKEGILTALLQRERTGKGCYVQVSLFDAAVSALANQGTNYLVAGHSPQRMGSEHPNIVPYGSVYTCRDGLHLVLAIGDDRQFRRLCQVLGDAALADNPDFATNGARVRNRSAVNQQLKQLISQHERDGLLGELHRLHVPAGAVNSVPEVFEQLQARRMLLTQPNGPSGIRQVAFVMEGTTAETVTPPPAFAQHQDQVMGMLEKHGH